MKEIGILIIDDDEQTQVALRHVLHAEGWRVHVVPLAREGLEELARGEWTLVIANVAMTPSQAGSAAFETLRELAGTPIPPEGKAPARVLFLVPELMAPVAQTVLERHRLPYALKPIHLHDLLEKISDLLLEAGAIQEPIRRVRPAHTGPERRSGRDRRPSAGRRPTDMFSRRDDYYMTEEEIAEYEKQEAEERKKKERRVEKLPY